MNRREFLADCRCRAARCTDAARDAGQGRHEGAGDGRGAHIYEAIHDWGTLPPSSSWGNTHGVVEDSQGTSTSTTPCTRPATARHHGRVRRQGQVRALWGAEFKGVAHGLHIRKEGKDEFLYLTANAANPKARRSRARRRRW